jgi:hypothetical protein
MSPTESSDFFQRIGATPRKLALVGVLGAVLTYVVVRPLLERHPPVELVTPPPTTAPAATSKSAPPAGKMAEPGLLAVKPWPQPDLERVATHDPFAVPGWARPAVSVVEVAGKTSGGTATNQRVETIAKLRELGAAVIVEVGGEPLALVGEHQLRVGDLLEGYRVKAITESGIVLASEGQSP